MNLAKLAIQNKGKLTPLLIPPKDMKGPSLCNPSVLNYNNKLLVNLRNLNYILYHSENNNNEHIWGPLVYLHPENDQTLKTYNILCELNNNCNIISYNYIDTSTLDVDPLWEFVGLEDGRLAYWEDKLFLCGVRRDTTTNGVGRMELSELVIENNLVKEVKRNRIPAPGSDDSYCEKNWMPVLDQPFTFIKWTNPTEIIRYNINENTITSNIIGSYKNFETGDLRGGSQVIKIKDYYVAIVHETDLYNSEAGRKNASYYHRFVIWDTNFNLKRISDKFKFMDAKIEFCCGLCEIEDNLYITFGFQDNAAFILRIPKDVVYQWLRL
jgi:hypothetical protein